MLGIGYIKLDPTTYVIHYSSGHVVRQGPGLAFFYYRPSSSIVAIPTASADAQFIFSEITQDFQHVTLQGQISYRVTDPVKVAKNFNFTLAPNGRTYVSDDPSKLPIRIVNICQVLARPELQKMPLKEALMSSQPIMNAVVQALKNNVAIQELGVEVFAFTLLAIKPTPEMSKAIEAEAREALQRRSDEAISERRNSAVEQERRIKENELRTDMIVQQKKQELARNELQADIGLEKQREELVDVRTENAKKEADANAYALAASLKPLASMDPKALQVLAASRTDPRVIIAQAMHDLAQDASKIGQLNITPDLLNTIMQGAPKK
jgi:regulator of protease activity HflC (stomatin/prohibitin superfamily)